MKYLRILTWKGVFSPSAAKADSKYTSRRNESLRGQRTQCEHSQDVLLSLSTRSFNEKGVKIVSPKFRGANRRPGKPKGISVCENKPHFSTVTIISLFVIQILTQSKLYNGGKIEFARTFRACLYCFLSVFVHQNSFLGL